LPLRRNFLPSRAALFFILCPLMVRSPVQMWEEKRQDSWMAAV
jgi:hypothetical protein